MRKELIQEYFSQEQIAKQQERTEGKKVDRSELVQLSFPYQVKYLHRLEHQEKLRG